MLLYLLFSALYPARSFWYPWLPTLGVVVVLVPDPGYSIQRDPTWQLRCDRKRVKWLRQNTRFLRTGFGRYRPVFYPPYSPPRVDFGDRILLRFRVVLSWVFGLLLRSVLLVLSDPILWLCICVGLCVGSVVCRGYRRLLRTADSYWCATVRAYPFLNRRVNFVVGAFATLLLLWYLPDLAWFIPVFPPVRGFRPPPQLYSTRVAGVNVLAHDVYSARLASPDNIDAEWLLHEDYLSEVELDPVGTPVDPQLIRDKLDQKLADARQAGISPQGFRRLRSIVHRHLDAFGDTLHGCHLSKLTPMDVTLKPDATPCIARARTFGPAAEAYLNEKLRTLEQIGVITPVKDANWSSAVFVVPKQNKPGEFRMVIDLRPLNSRVLPTALPMPNLESCLRAVTKAKCFGCFDVLSGFDNLPCTEKAAEYFVISTFKGLYKLHCSPQGFCNSAQTFHNRFVDEVLGDLWMSNVVQWIDDSLLFGRSETDYLDALERFLVRVKSKDLKLSIKKTVLYTLQAEFCGRTLRVTAGNVQVRFSERFYEAILQMGKPITGTHLAQAIYASNWLAPTIPRLAEHVAPLRAMLQRIQAARGSLKNKALVGTKLVDFGWDAQMDDVWDTFLVAIARAASLQTYDADLELCLFTDASDAHFASVVTQCSSAELLKPFSEQQHLPLFFLSGSFKGPQLNWHVSSKESWPILWSFQRFDWLFQGHPSDVHVFCDHQNLISIMDPSGKQAENKNTLSRLYRWALRLSEVRYKVYHIPGQFNVFADMLTRWGARVDPTPLVRVAATTLSVSLPTTSHPEDESEYLNFIYDRVRPLLQPDFAWPTEASILAAQRQALRKQPKSSLGLSFDRVWLHSRTKRIWLPKSAVRLRTRVVVIAHTISGHGSVDVTLAKIRRVYHAPGIRDLVQRFVKLCLHCDSGSRLIRRTYGEIPHGTERCAVLHADYLSMFDGYLLVIRDDLTSKLDLFYTTSADADTMAMALVSWRARYNLPSNALIVTDQGSHFANGLLSALAREMKFSQHFSVAYSPWANGSAEVTNWPKLIPQVVMYLNSMPRRSLTVDGVPRSPNSIFLGLRDEPDDLAPFVWKKKNRVWRCERLEQASLQPLFEAVAERLASTTKPIATLRSYIRDRERSRRNKLSGTLACSFSVGDIVLYSTASTKTRSKLQLTWLGPCVVTKMLSEHVYRLRTLGNDEFDCHVQRMKLYDTQSSAIHQQEVAAQYVYNAQEFVVDKFLDVRCTDGVGSLRVQWKGLDKCSWEPLQVIYSDLPDMVLEFLRSKSLPRFVRALGLVQPHFANTGGGE